MTSLPTSSPALSDVRPDLNPTFGAALIGMVIASLLYGACNIQVYIYYLRYPDDWIVYRVSVAILWILDGLNLALVVHFLYHALILNFGDYTMLDVVVWSFKLQVAINTVIVVIVHTLYVLRIWKLNLSYRKTLLPLLLPLFVLAGAGVGIVLIVETYKTNFFSDMARVDWVIYASFSTAVVIDIAIAGTMCYYLNGSRSTFASTNSRISALIIWSLGTGIVTSICSLGALIVYAAIPNSLVFLAFEFLLTKLYFNSLLAMLNDRKRINEESSQLSYSVSLSHPRTPRDLSDPGIAMQSWIKDSDKSLDSSSQDV